MKRLIVMVTQSCNSNCSYCMTNRGTKTLDNFPEDIDLSPYDFIMLFGGEPLLEKEKIYRIKDIAAAQNKKVFLPTNGILLTDQIVDDFSSILISSNGTKESCEKTGQPFVPHIVNIKNKDKCFIGIRIIPETADSLLKDFQYFWDAGFRKFNIAPIIEMDWQDEHLKKYEENVIEVAKILEERKQVWNWERGGICVPYHGTTFRDCDGTEYSCARFCEENIVLPNIQEKHFQKCLNCDKRDWCFHNCYYLNYNKTGSLTTPYIGTCKFADIYKRVFGEN